MNLLSRMRPAGTLLVALSALVLSPALAAESNQPPANTRDFSNFRVINDRNIFNPHRYARSSGQPERRDTRRPSRVEYFSLVGVMTYEKGTFAFFDSSRGDYRKTVQVAQKVGDFTISEIAPKAVKLQGSTNTYDLSVGMQLRREDEGEWHIAAAPEGPAFGYTAPAVSYAPSTVAASAPATPAGLPPGDFPPPSPEPQVIMIDPNGTPIAGVQAPQPEAGQTNAVPVTAESGGTEADVLRRLMQRREQEINR